MMQQILFAWEDIRKNKAYFLRFFIQITCVLLLLGFCVSELSSVLAFREKFRVFQDSQNMYILNDITDWEIAMIRREDVAFEEKCRAFYEYLTSLDKVRTYAYFPSILPVEKEVPSVPFETYPDGSRYYHMMCVDERFWNTFSLSCAEGRSLTKEDFCERQEKVPVVLGAYFREVYEIGDVMNRDYVVVGFLEEGAFFLDPGKTNEILYLRDAIMAPLVIDNNISAYELDTIITMSTLLTDDPMLLEDIENKSKVLELYDDLDFISYSDQLENIVEESMIYVYFAASILCIILLFCFVCIVSALMNYINTHKREFAVHILCGAGGKDLALRIVCQISTCLIVSNFITLLVFGFSKASAVIGVASLILLPCIVFLPVMTIVKKPLASFLSEVQG